MHCSRPPWVWYDPRNLDMTAYQQSCATNPERYVNNDTTPSHDKQTRYSHIHHQHRHKGHKTPTAAPLTPVCPFPGLSWSVPPATVTSSNRSPSRPCGECSASQGSFPASDSWRTEFSASLLEHSPPYQVVYGYLVALIFGG